MCVLGVYTKCTFVWFVSTISEAFREDALPKWDNIKDLWDENTIKDLWTEKKTVVHVLDLFLKSVLGQESWSQCFESSFTADFWKSVSKSDLGFLYYVLDLNYDSWMQEFEAGGRGSKVKDKTKKERYGLFASWCKVIDNLHKDHGEEVNTTYMEHCKELRKSETGEDEDDAATKNTGKVTLDELPAEDESEFLDL